MLNFPENQKTQILWEASLDTCRNLSLVLYAHGLCPQSLFKECLRRSKHSVKGMEKVAKAAGHEVVFKN